MFTCQNTFLRMPWRMACRHSCRQALNYNTVVASMLFCFLGQWLQDLLQSRHVVPSSSSSFGTTIATLSVALRHVETLLNYLEPRWQVVKAIWNQKCLTNVHDRPCMAGHVVKYYVPLTKCWRCVFIWIFCDIYLFWYGCPEPLKDEIKHLKTGTYN